MKPTTLTEAQALVANVFLPAGEQRSFLQCPDCGEVFVHDYIPYGLGQGRTYGGCSCILTSRNTYARAKTLLKVEGPLPKPPETPVTSHDQDKLVNDEPRPFIGIPKMPDELPDKVVCKGSVALGTGCGHCGSCYDEMRQLVKAKLKPTPPPESSGGPPPRGNNGTYDGLQARINVLTVRNLTAERLVQGLEAVLRDARFDVVRCDGFWEEQVKTVGRLVKVYRDTLL